MPTGPGPCEQGETAASVLALVVRERDRLGRWLHDRPMQDLTAVSLQIGLLALQGGTAASDLRAVESELIAGLGQLRAAMVDLAQAPPANDARAALAGGIDRSAPSTVVELAGSPRPVCSTCAAAYHQLGLGADPAWGSIRIEAVGPRITATPPPGAAPGAVASWCRDARTLGLAVEAGSAEMHVDDACAAATGAARPSADCIS